MIKTCRNLGIVFLLTGIWHGASWTFVVWGILHGFFIVIEKLFNIKEFDSKMHSFIINLLRHFYCILIFVSGWVIFRSDNLKYAYGYLRNMFFVIHLHQNEFMYTIHYYVDNVKLLPLLLQYCVLCLYLTKCLILKIK